LEAIKRVKTMGTKNTGWTTSLIYFRFLNSLVARSSHKGQALVEFTLIFMFLLVVAWIPADFGLAFYTGQLALNASREGARIAAADPNLAGAVGNCTLTSAGCYALADGTILKETAKRVSSALMPGATIRVCYPVASVNPVNANGTCNAPVGGGSTCNAQLAVTIRGDYNYSFYRFLRYFGASVPANVQIMRATQMRWEHQSPCT
jgi:Flp pilus assembly protein TadG